MLPAREKSQNAVYRREEVQASMNGMKYEIIDNHGVVTDAPSIEKANQLFDRIYNRQGEYYDFDWEGDLKLVEVLRLVR
jgi:hypothetical protein